MQTGWVYDQNKWYYLAGNGAMKTGWVKDAGSWYYLAGNGAMVAGKWLKDTDGSWYYLSGNGKMLTGKQKINGKVYSFKTNGVWVS
jgi:glucan-binding YG repeat protein